MEQDSNKVHSETIERWDPHQTNQDADPDAAISKGNAPVMRSKVDDLSIWETVRQYKNIGVVAMAGAFSASLDGYREFYLSLVRRE
jgi:hypothetical protein